jgi:AraC-like DNA-binding protein
VPVLDGCARLRRVLGSPFLSVDLWRCIQDGDALRAPRSHPEPVLSVILSGASVLLEDRRALIVEAGTGLLTSAGVAYRTTHPFGCGDMGCHVRPSSSLLEELRLPRARWTTVPLTTRAYLRFRLAVEAATRGETDGLELGEACLSLFAAIPERAAQDSKPPTQSRHVELVEDTKALLLRRFRESLSLHEVAKAVGTSAFHLARLFGRHTGLTLHGYRTRTRLLHALDRLEEARGTLTDLALDLGYSSQSHFTDAFRRAFGAPPGSVGRGTAFLVR